MTPPIVPLVHELPAEDRSRRILVFVMPATRHAHSFRRKKDGGRYYIRQSRSTVRAQNGLFRELMVRKQDLDPWDHRMHPEARVEDIDLVVLRDALQRTAAWDGSRTIDDHLRADLQIFALVPSLCSSEPLTNTVRPCNFTLLLFGRDVPRFVPGAHVVFSAYPGGDRSEPHSEVSGARRWSRSPLEARPPSGRASVRSPSTSRPGKRPWARSMAASVECWTRPVATFTCSSWPRTRQPCTSAIAWPTARVRGPFTFTSSPCSTGAGTRSLSRPREAPALPVEPYFEPLQEPSSTPAGSAVMLAVDGMHPIPEPWRDRLAERLGAATYHLQSASLQPMHPTQMPGAAAAVRRAVTVIGRRHPGNPLHILMSAPVALAVELGRQLAPAVFPSAIVHHLDVASATYAPVLDVVQRRVIPSELSP